MGDLGWIGSAENVWLVALGLACVAPLVAFVAPRLTRAAGLALAPLAFGLSLVATIQQQTMLALGLITVAVTGGFIASWSTRTLREAVGPAAPGRRPQHRLGGVALSRSQSRSFDYLLMRSR